MPDGPCKNCGAVNYPLSYGGPDICPACDCGMVPWQKMGKRYCDLMGKLTEVQQENTELKLTVHEQERKFEAAHLQIQQFFKEMLNS